MTRTVSYRGYWYDPRIDIRNLASDLPTTQPATTAELNDFLGLALTALEESIENDPTQRGAAQRLLDAHTAPAQAIELNENGSIPDIEPENPTAMSEDNDTGTDIPSDSLSDGLGVSIMSHLRSTARRAAESRSNSKWPTWVHSYRCHPLLSALLWEAAGFTGSAIADWMQNHLGSSIGVFQQGDQVVDCASALGDALAAIKSVMLSWDINDATELESFLRNQRRRAKIGKTLGAEASFTLSQQLEERDDRIRSINLMVVQFVLVLAGEAPDRPSRARTNNNPTEPPESAWRHMDGIDVKTIYRRRIRVLQSCPVFLRSQWRFCMHWALEKTQSAKRKGDQKRGELAWSVFALLPVLLLRKPSGRGKAGRFELEQRFDRFRHGHWDELLREVELERSPSVSERREKDASQRGREAMACVQMGEVSKARHRLTGATIAPGDANTLKSLQGKRPKDQQKLIPEDVRSFKPAVPLDLDRNIFLSCLKSSPRGSAAGPGGYSYELLRPLLDEPSAAESFMDAAEDFARANVPEHISEAFMMAHMTALRKQDG